MTNTHQAEFQPNITLNVTSPKNPNGHKQKKHTLYKKHTSVIYHVNATRYALLMAWFVAIGRYMEKKSKNEKRNKRAESRIQVLVLVLLPCTITTATKQRETRASRDIDDGWMGGVTN